MRNILSHLSSKIDWLTENMGKTISWLTLMLVLLIVLDVFMRYFLNSSEMWLVELEWHLFSVLFLLGASYTLLHDKHVRVDVFYERVSPKYKRYINIIGMLIFLIPWCLLIINTSWDYASNSFSFRERSSQPGGLPARYIIKFFIWGGFMMLLLQGFSELIKLSLNLKKEL